MNDNEINEAIAQTRGWTFLEEAVSHCSDPYEGTHAGEAWLKPGQAWDRMEWWQQRERYDQEVPRYVERLDAIVPVIRSSLFSVRDATLRELRDVMSRELSTGTVIAERQMAFATPRQWCEAYLRAKGIWKE